MQGISRRSSFSSQHASNLTIVSTLQWFCCTSFTSFAGTAGSLKVQLSDTAANCSKENNWAEIVLRLVSSPQHFPGFAGTAGTLKVQLSDTAANSSKDEQLATAEVKLDMRQWKDSQTYQAQVELNTTQVRL